VASKFFVDTNILLYLIDTIEPKARRARELVESGPVISVQVLNEFANTARRKFKWELDEIAEALAPIRLTSQIEPLTIETHDRAMAVASSTGLGIYDANIVSAAELAGCDTLYTEDMNHGQRIGSVTIRNPFETG
jgi:predicted nucleic acid-binding protein